MALFREQNLQRVNNPDALDDYIHIANPGVWMVLVIILLLLGAAVIWGLFGTVTVTTPGYLVVERGATTLWLPEEQALSTAPGSRVEAADTEGMVVSAAGAPEPVTEVMASVAEDGEIDVSRFGQWVCPLAASVNLPTGQYPATVVLQTYSPLELLLGGGQADAGANR